MHKVARAHRLLALSVRSRGDKTKFSLLLGSHLFAFVYVYVYVCGNYLRLLHCHQQFARLCCDRNRVRPIQVMRTDSSVCARAFAFKSVSQLDGDCCAMQNRCKTLLVSANKLRLLDPEQQTKTANSANRTQLGLHTLDEISLAPSAQHNRISVVEVSKGCEQRNSLSLTLTLYPIWASAKTAS